ncbi:hypothetical protein EMCG_04897 [[Emmonsia] crescens]|uniref:Uncharacterized protein n=1 Tax=[Emmonsia] crescens TaxID=73230 RepID=A0A0G2IY87_9EURO|nr:hypothetical protein EMCG_04897 [Emmonsia crescens UAMH 3008]
MLSSLFTRLAGFTSSALGMDVQTGKLNGLRWHITSLWEEYGHIQQIGYTCSLCGQLPDAKLRRGVENLREKMGDLQVVCEERSGQLEADLEEDLEEDLFHREDDLAPSPEIRDGDVSHLPLPERPICKRPSDGDFSEQKRLKMSEANDVSYNNSESN